jgi:predicted GH43/DUF377 family glycosyl hydrolase
MAPCYAAQPLQAECFSYAFLAYADDLLQWQNSKLLAKAEFEWENQKIDGNTLFVYYGGAVKYVGLATCKLEALVDYLRTCPCDGQVSAKPN